VDGPCVGVARTGAPGERQTPGRRQQLERAPRRTARAQARAPAPARRRATASATGSRPRRGSPPPGTSPDRAPERAVPPSFGQRANHRGGHHEPPQIPAGEDNARKSAPESPPEKNGSPRAPWSRYSAIDTAPSRP